MLFLLALAVLPCALAAPPAHAEPIHIPIVRRANVPVANLPQIMDAIRLKYGFRTVNQKRSTTSASLTDEVRLFSISLASTHFSQQNDSSYSAVVSIGTPCVPLLPLPRSPANSLTAPRNSTLFSIPASFHFALASIVPHPSLGSSDLWVATTQCTTCTSDVPLFNPSKSSSFKNGSSGIQITYGSGDVGGYVSEDTVTFSGFTISGQELRALLSLIPATPVHHHLQCPSQPPQPACLVMAYRASWVLASRLSLPSRQCPSGSPCGTRTCCLPPSLVFTSRATLTSPQ
jgi:cathepsin D